MSLTKKVNFEYFPELHDYKLNGVIISGVTTILQKAGLISFDFVSPEHLAELADLGHKVHTTCELWDRDNLDMDSLHPILKGYLDSWIKFITISKYTFEAIETPIFSAKYRIAGTPDRITTGKILIDIKIGVPKKADPIQTAGYALIYDEDKKAKDRIKRRMSVYLDKKGGIPKTIEYKESTDKIVFLAALTITNFLRRR